MASTGTVAVAVGSAAAAVTFALVSIIGSASPRPDLGGPVIVERPAETAAPTPTPPTDTGSGAEADDDAGENEG